MQGNASTMRFSDNQGVTHHLPCSKGVQQGDGSETIRFAVNVHLSIGRVCERHLDCKVVGNCDNIFIIVSHESEASLISARVGLALRTRRAALVSVWPFGAPYPCNSSSYFIILGAKLVCPNGRKLLPSAALVKSCNHCLQHSVRLG